MGRRKIEIEPLTDERNRTVTFVKRKAGLFKKAHELSVLCQVDLAVIIIGNNNKIYEFSSVDTNDLISNYQKNVKLKKKPHESKSHDNYSDYKKKSKLSDHLSTKSDQDKNVDLDTDNSDSEYDSDSPQPKKRSKLTNNNNNNNSNNNINKMEINQRPILRVQIPKDQIQSQDSGKTLTALETGVGDQSIPKDPPNLSNNLTLPKYSNYTSYRSPDSRKPPVLLPIHAKSQSSSPADVSAPQLPFVAANNYFNNISQASPNSNYPNILPTPILNQVLNSTFDNNNSNNHTNNNNNNTSNNTTSNNTNNPSNNPNNTAPNTTTNVTTSSNSSSITSTNSNPIDKNRLNPKFRPPLITNFNHENNPPPTNPEQTPFSSLRNVYEMFPSPSNFYNPQDWPQGNTGMTPIHTNAGNYFMNMLPSGGPSGPSGPGPGAGGGGAGPSNQSNQLNNGNLPINFQGNYNNQNRQSVGSFPSPLQYMGQGFNQQKKS